MAKAPAGHVPLHTILLFLTSLPTHTLASPTHTSTPDEGRARHHTGPFGRSLRALRGVAGGVRRALVRVRDGMLHPLRRRRARARLARLAHLEPPSSVVFLCLGNVCRSPYAEHRFRALAAAAGRDDLVVVSAGFIGPGRPAAELAVAQAARRGIDTGRHRSRLMDLDLLDGADLVVLVDATHGGRLRRTLGRHGVPTLVLGDLDPQSVDRRTIRDPWGQDPAVYQRVFDRLDRCLDEMARVLFGAGGGGR